MEFIKKAWNRINNSLFNTFTLRDKRQILTLLGFLAVIFAVNIAINHSGLFHTKIDTTDPEIASKLALLDQRLAELQDGDTLSRLDRYIIQRYDTISLFAFDPNTATKETLLQLGLTDKQASNLINYRKNGGHFRTAEDFRKLYGMRTLQYKILSPYIKIAGTSTAIGNSAKVENDKDGQWQVKDQETRQERARKEYFEFDPNTISAEDIERLGFSPKQAESFIKWRDKGKKFYIAKDFSTTFFVDAERYRELEPYIKIDLDRLFNGVKMLDLNTATDADMRSAGLTGEEAARIIDFRENVGYYYVNWQIEDALPTKKRANELKQKFYVCSSVDLRKININSATLDDLEAHPYISSAQAQSIVKLRESSRIESLDALTTAQIFTDKEIKRLRNYIIF